MEWDISTPQALKDCLKRSKAYKGLSEEHIDSLVKIIINSIITQLVSKKKVEIRGFGSFKLTKYTSSTSTVYKVHFKSSNILNKRINDKHDE